MKLTATAWIDLLARYGPAALFVFMVFILLGMARTTKGLSNEQRKVQNVAYGFVWLSIFILAAMIVISWWQGNFPKEFVVRGTISNLTYPQTITTFQPVFLHRTPVAGLDFQYEWRYISPTRFTGPLEVLLQKGSGSTRGSGGTALLKYKVQIRDDYYDGEVDIEYNQKTDEMVLTHGKYTETILPVSTPFATDAPEPKQANGLVSANTVYAASVKKVAKPEDLIRALDVDDPLIRASARRDLIGLGPKAIPYLEQALIDAKSSYRLRVGILSTLKDMGSANLSLGELGLCAVARASKDGDLTLSKEGQAVLATGVVVPQICSLLELRTDRILDEDKILKSAIDKQRKALGVAFELYKQRVPYKWGGKQPSKGLDSSGYVAYILANIGVIKDPATYWSGKLFTSPLMKKVDHERVGDIIFYGGGICMIYLGDHVSIGMLPGGIATGNLDVFPPGYERKGVRRF